MMDQCNWFSIKYIASNKVISSCGETQVIVRKPQHTDHELWRWNGQHLENKSTGLVLDIREGKLRAIEDTEICLCYKKTPQNAHSQLWAVRMEKQAENFISRSPLQDSRAGQTICSVCSSDWVLDVCPEGQKVILFPQDLLDTSLQQKWEFIPQDVRTPCNEPLLSSDDPAANLLAVNDYIYRNSSVSTCESIGFAHGLTPARRNTPRSTLLSRDDGLGDEIHELMNRPLNYTRFFHLQ